MTNEENEGSTGEQASGLEPDTQQIPTAPTPPAWPLPPSGSVPVGAAPAGPPTAPTPAAPPVAPAVGAPLSTHPHLAPSGGGGYQGPPPPPYGYGWAQPPAASPTPSSHHASAKWLAAVGAAAALVVASVAIGHAVWSSPTHIASAGASNNTGTPNSGGSANPFGGGSGASPFGGGTPSSGSGSSNSSVGSGPKDASSIASKVDPGLVDIDGVLGYQDDEDAGTGMVLTSNGLVLTNNHVIEGATSLSVTDIGNGKTYTASVVGYDRDKDIAVIQLANASGLTTANLGNSSNVSVGQAVVGVGNAGGTGGTPSYAGGTVTALNQSITASDEGDGTSEQLTGLIETNANIQPGDSGGPLVNTSGQILGIDTAASDTYTFQGEGGSGDQGYTIPINTALSIAHEIEAGNASSTVHVGATPFLGVDVATDASSSGGEGFFGGGGSEQTAPGALIEQTVTSGPAQEAGLTEGDLITGVDGTNITSPTALTNALLQDKPGDSVTITYTDPSGNSHTTTAKLSSGPPQ